MTPRKPFFISKSLGRGAKECLLGTRTVFPGKIGLFGGSFTVVIKLKDKF